MTVKAGEKFAQIGAGERPLEPLIWAMKPSAVTSR
jgi:hypothetical protein